MERVGLKRRISNYMYDRLADNDVSFTAEGIIILMNYKIYKNTCGFLTESQSWSKEKIKKYQLKKLHQLIKHSYENVPYYKELFDKNEIKIEDVNDFNDLQKIPFLTKEIVKKNIEELKSINYPKYSFSYLTTGGSTGTPLGFFDEKSISYVKELAYTKTVLDRIGYKYKDKFVVFKGAAIPSAKKGKFWKYSSLGRSLVFSSFYMNEKNLPRYIKKISEFKPQYIVGYPSAITLLGKYIKNNNIKKFQTFKGIICSAETLYKWQKDFLEEIFGCKVLDNYALSEQVVFAASCEKSDDLHVFPEYGFVELIDKNGRAIICEGEKGEIVATGFKNFIFPFIRYKTGDFGIYTNKKCECGRSYRIIKQVEGREQEFIVTTDGRQISMAAMNMHSNVFDNVKQFQFYQDKKGEVVFRIIKNNLYSEKDSRNIKQELYKKLGENIDLKLEFVDEIQKTFRGKHSYLIQKLDENNYNSNR